ncbi:hypothetical protein BRPE64_ECDS02490 (plasmid) [Caballeronia insecticola]|uniref:Uncharacterized protein n=1 Tax=Caballeronia insecticola TaxID=758793 RepID=A0A060PKN5_9BURK|nr:hypothetical protein BRPE64_ECDS02490 [Caballeronia insecticola]
MCSRSAATHRACRSHRSHRSCCCRGAPGASRAGPRASRRRAPSGGRWCPRHDPYRPRCRPCFLARDCP